MASPPAPSHAGEVSPTIAITFNSGHYHVEFWTRLCGFAADSRTRCGCFSRAACGHHLVALRKGWVASPSTVSLASEFCPALAITLNSGHSLAQVAAATTTSFGHRVQVSPALNHEGQYEGATTAVGIRQCALARGADQSHSKPVRFVKHGEQPSEHLHCFHKQQGQGHRHS